LLTNAGTYLDYGGIGGSASAWDPARDAFVLVDGCSDVDCNLDAWTLTWVLNTTGWHTFDYGPGFGSKTWLGFTGMAYDPVDGYLVLFGGWDFESAHPQNYTYTYSYTGDVAYGSHWDNISAADASCAIGCTPAGRDDDAITWDAQLGAVFMTAGYNYTYGEYNDSWEFLAGLWYALSPQAPAAFVPLEGPALAVNSTNIGVFLVGGSCPTSCSERQWVFESPPQSTLTETPQTIDLGAAVTFTAGWVAGTGTGWYAGWNFNYGNGQTNLVRAAAGQNSSTAYTKAFPYTYAGAGTFTANVSWSDFFYISSAQSPVSLTVNPALVATITASATTITAGRTVTFSTTPTGGSGSYTYAWSFGDGTTSTAEGPPAHAYAKAGTYVVNLTVTDTASGVVKDTLTITVKAAPTGLSLGSTGTYLVVGIVVAVLVILAALLLMRRRKKPAAAQPWQGGTPPAGAVAPPPGAGADVPPGVGGAPPPPPPTT
jgi:PKD repeat protein